MEAESFVFTQHQPARPSVGELREVTMFAELEDRVLHSLSEIAESHVFEAGHRLYAQGDMDAPLCLLTSGQISSFRTAPDGTITVVDVVQPSGHAGLQSILTQLPALIGVETVAPS